ncbi:MAG: hypothetical protein K0U45_05645 [Alphaproteobacteria bacterium]|nr:hypothetical protein [Alphaproteobacteria bacterium]
MWHFTPYFNINNPDKIWHADESQKLVSSLALTSLLTEKHEAHQQNFWGNPNIGSVLARYLKKRYLDNQPIASGIETLDIIKQEITERLQFLINENLAHDISVHIEARAQHYAIKIIIDDTILTI